jgi:hypothetical protein
VVGDCFTGAGTTQVEALRLGRDAWGCEPSPGYHQMAVERVRDDSPLFNTEGRPAAIEVALNLDRPAAVGV